MRPASCVRWPARQRILRLMAMQTMQDVGRLPKSTGKIPNVSLSIWVHTSYMTRSSTVQKNDANYVFSQHLCVQSMWQRGAGCKLDILWILPNHIAQIWSALITRMPQNRPRRVHVLMCLLYVCFALQAVLLSGSIASKPISENATDSPTLPTSHAL
jgi:hypothetical protein